MEIQEVIHRVLAEVDNVLGRVDESETRAFCREILRARRIFVYSMGREGLVMRSFAMRLMHLGLNVAVVGDMTTPPIGIDDLLILSCGPGASNTLQGLAETAHNAGGKVAVITAQREGNLCKLSDLLVFISAQTMAEDEGSKSVQPMGSGFEQSEWILFDVIIILLIAETGQTAAAIRERHTNLE